MRHTSCPGLLLLGLTSMQKSRPRELLLSLTSLEKVSSERALASSDIPAKSSSGRALARSDLHAHISSETTLAWSGLRAIILSGRVLAQSGPRSTVLQTLISPGHGRVPREISPFAGGSDQARAIPDKKGEHAIGSIGDRVVGIRRQAFFFCSPIKRARNSCDF